jgi:hypothetical protein
MSEDADPAGETTERWLVFVGRTQRSETANPQAALMFARLLADLIKRPVWVCHQPDGPLERFESFVAPRVFLLLTRSA